MITNKKKNNILKLLIILLPTLYSLPAYPDPGITITHRIIYKDPLKINTEINFQLTIKNIGTSNLSQINLNTPYSTPDQTANPPLLINYLPINQEVTVQWSDFYGAAYQQDDNAVHFIGAAESEGDGMINLDVVSYKVGTEN